MKASRSAWNCLPTVDMTVIETEPGLKGATVSNVTKPAKMETGLVVQVPPFIRKARRSGSIRRKALIRNGPELPKSGT